VRRQITLVTIAATAMVVLSFLAPLALLVRTVVAQHAIDEANAAAQSVVPVAVSDRDPANLERIVAQADTTTDGTMSLYLEDGTIVGEAPFAVRPESLALAHTGRAFTQSFDGGVEVFLPIIRPETTGPVVRVVVPDSVLHHNVYAIWFLLGALGLAMIVVAGLVADRIARSIIRPLLATGAIAEQLAGGDLSARAADAGTAEVKVVAGALNALADRVSELLQEERESLANLSHELRTPVTALRLTADQIRDPADAQRIGELIGRVEEAVTHLIDRARNPKRKVDHGDLAVAVVDRVSFWSVLARAQQRPVHVTVERESLPVRATRADLDVTIDALIGNVFAHTPGGCGFEVRAVVRDGLASLIVDDGGPGMKQTDIHRGRSRSGRAGTGLGLDIARRVAEKSGGKLVVMRSPAGGARVIAEFGSLGSSLS